MLSALCLLTPLRGPLLAVVGRDIPALEHRMRAQRDTMDALQQRASETRLAPTERAALDQVRNDYVATRERIDARTRMNARLNLLGIFDAIQELFPWLLAFGFAFPVFGGLIGAQVIPRSRAVTVVPRPVPEPVPPPSVGIPPVRPTVPPPVASPVVSPVTPPVAPPAGSPQPRTAYVHPAAAAAAPTAQRPLPGSPVVLPPSVSGPAAAPKPPEVAPLIPPVAETPSQDWGFRHQPTPLEPRPRTKLPPVRSHNIFGDDALNQSPRDPLQDPSDETPLA